MNRTLMEIARYCREENTFGALLFCGEWGSGKTHLLEHDLPEELGNSFLLLRISLFGEESLEGIRRKVRQACADRVAELLPEPGARGQSADDAVRPAPLLAGRRLVLAFDDLERTNLSQVELLGCINEYCENLHIKTIVTANEEKIEHRQAQGGSGTEERKREYLAYAEMKEKVIARTVRLEMDEEDVIRNIVEQYRTPSADYRLFLEENRDELLSLLEDLELHNIRSLRCGLQDFERVRAWCLEEGLPAEEIRRIFSSFVLFTMLAKNGKISRSGLYGYALNRLQHKYGRHYSDQSLPDCLKDGIMTGNWEEEKIRRQLRRRKEFLQGIRRPENRILSRRLEELDDETLREGWGPFLEMMYGGIPEPADYVLLLRNLHTARIYGYTWPSAPDFEKLRGGLSLSFERLCEAGAAPEPAGELPDEQEVRGFNEDELALYRQILHCLDRREVQMRLDYDRLLAACEARDEEALYRCRRCVIRSFDDRLAKAAAECYAALPEGHSRAAFQALVLKILAAGEKERFGDDSGPSAGRALLARRLKTLSRQMEKAGQPHAAMAARIFLAGLEKNGADPDF